MVPGRPLYGRRDSPATASGLAFSGQLFAVARQMGRSWGMLTLGSSTCDRSLCSC